MPNPMRCPPSQSEVSINPARFFTVIFSLLIVIFIAIYLINLPTGPIRITSEKSNCGSMGCSYSLIVHNKSSTLQNGYVRLNAYHGGFGKQWPKPTVKYIDVTLQPNEYKTIEGFLNEAGYLFTATAGTNQ